MVNKKILKQKLLRWLESSNFGLRVSLIIRYGVYSKPKYPQRFIKRAVLKNINDVNNSVKEIHDLGLPIMTDIPKNWDSLIALKIILKFTDKDSKVFDAGGEIYSMILPWLFLYGYKNLLAGNLVFDKPIKRGSIIYRNCDITKTKFDAATYDAITCLSVIEHGVDINEYFKEMSRILKPGGVLIVSTDYFETPIDTKGKTAYGAPIHIFSKDEIVEILEIAAKFGLTPLFPIELGCDEKVVNWKKYDLNYTFIVLPFHKTDF